MPQPVAAPSSPPAARATRRPRILLVGPYERDNLGDLLFLLVTERYLEGADVTAAAPFAADMRALLDREIPAYGPLLREQDVDVIWTVGGQVGGVDVRRAYRMAATAEQYAAFQRASRDEQLELLRDGAGGAPNGAPYLPSPVHHARNAGAIAVANSIGLGSLLRADPVRRAQVLSTLRAQTVLSVRDPASSRMLRRHGIAHRLRPDAVHALSRLHPVPTDHTDEDVAVFQISRAILRRHGHRRVADALAASRALRRHRLLLLPAGIATGHDRLDDLEAIARRLRRRAPYLQPEVVTTRRPLELADLIGSARIVIGSSLHMRIIAASYGVPRVSLARPKVDAYAAHWDGDMPYGATPETLDDAIAGALARGRTAAAHEHAAALTDRAHEHLTRLSRRVLRLAAEDTEAARAERADARRQHQLVALTEQVALQQAELTALRRPRRSGPLARLAARAARPLARPA